MKLTYFCLFFFNHVPEDLEYIREELLDLLKEKDKDPVQITYKVAIFMLLGKATANIIPDIENSESK